MDFTKQKILLIGCGKMGSSLLKGWLNKGVNAANVFVVDPFPSEDLELKEVNFLKNFDFDYLSKQNYDFCIIAIKPQLFEQILPDYNKLKSNVDCFISIAAGKSIDSIEKFLGQDIFLVRAMPNLPATIGAGITGVVANENVSTRRLEDVESLLQCNGEVIRLADENMMDAFTAISGSGPGYIFYLIECIKKIAIEKGFNENDSDLMARQLVFGSAELAKASLELEPAELRKNVTSPGGTTEAGLNVLMQNPNGLFDLLQKTVYAAESRSLELK